MKRIFPIIRTAIFLLSVFCFHAAAREPDFRLSIEIPHTGNEPTLLRLTDAKASPRFHVILTNTVAVERRIFQEWCSWGYFALSFELTDEKGKTWKLQKAGRIWTRNFPASWTFNSGESYVFDISLTDQSMGGEGFWLPPDHPTGRVTLKASYSVTPGEDSKKLDVWTGTIESKPVVCDIK